MIQLATNLTKDLTDWMRLLVIGVIGFLPGCSKNDDAQPAKPKFAELSQEDTSRLERKRGVVAVAARQRYGTAELTKTKADLPVLQRLLDDKAFTKAQTYELQCLGRPGRRVGFRIAPAMDHGHGRIWHGPHVAIQRFDDPGQSAHNDFQTGGERRGGGCCGDAPHDG